MEQLDYVYINSEKYKELLKQFDNLWRTETWKLNAFIKSGEFALNRFYIKCFSKNGYTLTHEINYSKNTKKLTITNEEHGYEAECTDIHIVDDNFSSKKGSFSSNITVGYESKRHKQLLYEAVNDQGRNVPDFIMDLIALFIIVNIVVINLPRKLKEETKKETRTIEVKKKGKGKIYKPVVYLKHSYYFGDDFKLTKNDITHIIKCPAWGVRGHLRHYKSGKVIFIKPYTKGKYRNDKDKYVSKNYKL